MFYYTSSLTELNLSSFDTSNISNMDSLFTGSAIRKLTLGPSFIFKGNIELADFPNAPENRFWSHTTSSWQSDLGLALVNYHNELIETASDDDFVYHWVGEDGWNNGSYAEGGEWSFEEDGGILTLKGGRVETVDYVAPWISQVILENEIQKVIFSNELPINGGKSLSGLFIEYIHLETIEFNQFDTSAVIDMTEMFAHTPSLSNLDVSKFVTDNVHNMGSMFGLSAIESLDLRNFNTSNVESMEGMFFNMPSLQTLDLSSFSGESLQTIKSMFLGTPSLQKLILSKAFTFIDLDKVQFTDPRTTQIWTHTENSEWSSETSLELMEYHNDQVENHTGDKSIFTYEKIVKSIAYSGEYADGGKWFFNDGTLTFVGGRVEEVDGKWPWLAGRLIEEEDIHTVIFSEELPIYGGEILDMLFKDYIYLEKIEFNEFDTSAVKRMRSMFRGTSSLTQLDLSNFNTASLTDMTWMFSMSAVEHLDLSSFNTPLLRKMESTFREMPNLISLDLRNLIAMDLNNMELMFYDTPKLERLIINNNFAFPGHYSIELGNPSPTQKWSHFENPNWSAATSNELYDYHNELVDNHIGPDKIFTYLKVDRDSGGTDDKYVLNIPATLQLDTDGATLPVGIETNSESGVWVSLSGLENNQLILRNEQLENTYFWTAITHNDELITDDFGIAFEMSGQEILQFSAPERVGEESFYDLEFTAPLIFTASLIQD